MSPVKRLNAYMVFCRQADSAEGACLVFAHNTRDALALGRPLIQSWFDEVRFVDVSAHLIREADHLFKTEANQEKLERGEAHLIEAPCTCKRCEKWGLELGPDGNCIDEALCEGNFS